MSTISKEAIDEARDLYDKFSVRAIAAALQKHMDATAWWQKKHAQDNEALALQVSRLVPRAEAAERALAELLSGLRWALAQDDAGELRARVAALVDEYEDE